MHQAILMHPDIHKCAKVGDIRHHSVEALSRLDVPDFRDVIMKADGFGIGPGIAAGLGQFGENVFQGGSSGLAGDVGIGIDLRGQRRIADQPGEFHPQIGRHLFHDGVMIGVNRGAVQGIPAC